MRSIAVLALVLLSLVVVPIGGSAAGEQWRTTETEHFVFEYRDGYGGDVEQLRKILSTGRSDLLSKVPDGATPTLERKIRVRLYPGSEWHRSDGTLYWESSDPVRIHVQAPSDAPTGSDWYEHGLLHEYANIVLWDYARDEADYDYYGRNPSWFAEGVSEYLVFRTSQVEDQFPPREMQAVNESIRNGAGYFDRVGAKRYHGGHLLAQYMFVTYDDAKVWAVLANGARTFPTAVEESLGVTYLQFKSGWLAWAESNVGGEYPTRATPTDSNAEALEARVESLQRQLERRNRTISSLRERLVDRNRTVHRLLRGLAAANRTIGKLRTQLDRLNRSSENDTTARPNVTIRVRVEPADGGQNFTVGEGAAITAQVEGGSAEALAVRLDGERYELRESGATVVPLDAAGVQTLAVSSGDRVETTTIRVRNAETSTAASTTHGTDTGEPTATATEARTASGPGAPGFTASAAIAAVAALSLLAATRGR